MNNKIVFLHIEKAAGSTIHEIMYANFFPYYVATPIKYIPGGDNQNRYLRGEQLDRIFKYVPCLKAAGGHPMRCYDHGGLDDCYYFTFLRDPISRYISHYFYQIEVMGVRRSFDEFLNDASFNNFMCRKLCGVESAEHAARLLEEKEVLVGLVEYFDESLERLKHFIVENNIAADYCTGYVSANRRSDRPARGEERTNAAALIRSQYRLRIIGNNSEDIKLYKYIENRHFSQGSSCGRQVVSRGYTLKVRIGKIVRRILFVSLEKMVGYRGV